MKSAAVPILAVFAISLIGGGVAALMLSSRVHNGGVILVGLVGGSLLFAAIAAVRTVALSALTLALVGICGGLVISLIVANIQATAAEEARGRVMAMYSIGSQVVPAASGMAAGLLVNMTGTITAILLSGISLALIAVAASVFMPALRNHA